MRLFNVLISPEGESELKNSFNKTDFEFVNETGKFNNKFISNSLINQRLRIDRNINIDDSDMLNKFESHTYLMYGYKSYDVVNGVSADIVLNDKTLNPLLLQTTPTTTEYELMYINLDPRFKLISYEVEAYDKIIVTYHKKDFYGCALYFNRERHATAKTVLFTAIAMDTTKNNSIVKICIDIDTESKNSIVVSYHTNGINFTPEELKKIQEKKPLRFKLKLNPHKIPTALVVVNSYKDTSTPAVHLDSVVSSKNVMYVELGDHSVNDLEFIQYLKDIIAEDRYKALTLVDVFMPNDVIKNLGVINVFAYDSSKKSVKCIRSA